MRLKALSYESQTTEKVLKLDLQPGFGDEFLVGSRSILPVFSEVRSSAEGRSMPTRGGFDPC
jgi:hypothetical protein